MTPFRFIDIQSRLHAKHHQESCGDVLLVERNQDATIIILCDGLGSGIKANMAATFAATRLMELINQGFSSRDALGRIVQTMHEAKIKNLPYAAIALCTILCDGQATLLTYEMPQPIAMEDRYAYLPARRALSFGDETVYESHLYLKQNHDLMLISDGVSQAGLGKRLPMGWQEEGVIRFINKSFQLGASKNQLVDKIGQEVLLLDDNHFLDDASILYVTAKPGNTVTLLSGPPTDKQMDPTIVETFMADDGIKIICGASTANMAASYLKRPITLEDQPAGHLEPPKYNIPGIDLTTEGAITLNQVFNLCDQPMDNDYIHRHPSAVLTICSLIQFADRIHFIVGTAENPAHEDIKFMQLGILPRLKIIPKLVAKLKAQGKLVVVDYL